MYMLICRSCLILFVKMWFLRMWHDRWVLGQRLNGQFGNVPEGVDPDILVASLINHEDKCGVQQAITHRMWHKMFFNYL